MKFSRHFTKSNLPITEQIEWKTVSSEIKTSDGTRIFYMPEVEVPNHWSQGATNILAQKYFRKAGIPNRTKTREIYNEGEPTWLNKNVPVEDAKFGSESSARQVFHRLAGAWTYWGWKEGIFKEYDQAGASRDNEDFARIFYDEIYYMLAMQIAAPNSPQFFNTGLNWAYGIIGDKSGQWRTNEQGETIEVEDSYTNSQTSACFIQPISDNLVEPGGIFDLLRKEALIFKHGSGTGTNFSNIRAKGEKLSGGGVSSGLMSFLKIFDVGAGSISSGGVTRRAAKMICLDLDHPEIEEFVELKMREENKAAALFVGSMVMSGEGYEHQDIIPQSILDRYAADGENAQQEIYDLDFEGKAMSTVDGQNANYSVRITDEFLQKVDTKSNWPLYTRNGKKIIKVLQAKDLWLKICRAAWACADPGLQFHDTINLWHTCKADGDINASNPCSEYMHLDDTACNLASLNLGKFLFPDHIFDIKSFTHATRLWTTVLEISVFMASFPSKEIAHNSYLYRTLGLGYCNAGGVLMRQGIGYDSNKGRDYIASITALMHGQAYLTSQEMAQELGPFQRWENNKSSMSEVMFRHKKYLRVGSLIWIEANNTWARVEANEPFRNAQATLIAPTGTIALLMDCDTTGIEPDFSLVKYKHLSGGGMMKIVNECVPEALKTLSYTPAQIMSITQHITNHDTIEGWMVNGQSMPEEHLKVFDCAVPGGNGIRFLPPMAHVKMVAAVQPFLSGAVSKTVNMPNSTTITDVDHIYREAHRFGLKAIAIYRDGSKLTQPLNTGQKKEGIIINSQDWIKPDNWIESPPSAQNLKSLLNTIADTRKELKDSTTSPNHSEGRVPAKEFHFPNPNPKEMREFVTNEMKGFVEELVDYVEEEEKPEIKPFDDLLNKTPDPHPHIQRGKRLRLPPRTTGYTQKFSVDGQSIYLITGEYEDGTLGQIFIEFSRGDSFSRALMNSVGKSTSIGLQHGIPLQVFVDAFVFTKFEPSGIVHGHDRIKLCTSPLDLIFKDLAIHYLNQEEFANTPSNMTQQELNDTVNFIMNESSKDATVEIINHPSKTNIQTPERSEGRVPAKTDEQLDPTTEPTIGGTHLCRHGRMALICSICTPAHDPESKKYDSINIGKEFDEFIKATINVEGLGSSLGNTVTTSGIETFDAPDPDSTTTQDSIIFSGLRTSIEETNYSKPLTTIRLKHGDSCTACGHYPTLRTGTCITCPNCGANSGCG